MTTISRLVRSALLLLALLGASPSPADETPTTIAANAAPPTARPNVVVVVIDDMAWEDLELLPTPHLDGLIERGQSFTNFYVHPVCSPSRISLHAGVYGRREGVTSAMRVLHAEGKGLSEDRLTIGRVLHASGWATACFGKWHMNQNGTGRLPEAARRFGFEHWGAGCRGNIGREGLSSQSDWDRIDDGVVTKSTVYSSIALTHAFAQWWTQDHGDRPRFAVVNHLTPHEPWTVPPSALLPEGYNVGLSRRKRFEASVIALDHSIGHLVEQLDLDDTYLFVLPDNGTPHQVPPPSELYKGYKLSVWQGGIHVPLVVVGPGVEPRENSHLAHIVDVPETILELCGASVPYGFEDGASFAASLHGEMAPRAPVFVAIDNKDFDRDSVRDDWAVIDADGMKLVSVEDEIDVYDLASDPYETTPIYAPQVRDRLRAVKDAIAP